MQEWRHDIHAHPELAFEEDRTSDIVARELKAFGIEVYRGLGKTGVVGVLNNGKGPSIGLRADMDALPIHEANDFDHRSKNDGKMHACGHDGHTSMLLGAAKYLAETRQFKGTINFIFQPAEEGEGGARVMIEDGLFEKFPCDTVYGVHNMPGKEAGSFHLRPGPLLAAYDTFQIKVRGRGCHGAMPHQGLDPIVVAAHVVTALQTITSRNLDPVESAVISVTQIHAGDTNNVIPESVFMEGTTRSFKPEIRDWIEASMQRVIYGVSQALGAEVEFDYLRRYPATINHIAETEIAAKVAAEIAGETKVSKDTPPTMGGEDFAFMLEKVPGCYLFIGNGAGQEEGSCMIHNPNYDFNDQILPIGASYFSRLVETVLPVYFNLKPEYKDGWLFCHLPSCL
jgi:amidohydrolase